LIFAMPCHAAIASWFSAMIFSPLPLITDATLFSFSLRHYCHYWLFRCHFSDARFALIFSYEGRWVFISRRAL
jgi:hypothetical protein